MRTTSVSRWPIWGERKRVLALIAVVEVLAVVLPTTLWSPLSLHHLKIGLFLVGLSLGYSQIAFGWERVRRVLLFRRVPSVTPSVQATWCLAGALLLPPALAAAVTASCWAGAWRTYNPAGTRRRHRYFYTTMANVLAATACSWVSHGHLPGPLVAPAAGVLWMATTCSATALAIAAAGDVGAARSLLRPRAHGLVVATVALAAGGYYASLLALPALALSVPAAIGVQRFFARAELRAQEAVDSLMTEPAWVCVAEVLVQVLPTCSVVRVDASDLAEAARAITLVQSGSDPVGRYGRSGIAVLLPECPPRQGDAMARRVATALANRGVSCRIASASSPRDGRSVHALLAICEAELILRGGQTAESEHGRN